jgi:hypothetical protein
MAPTNMSLSNLNPSNVDNKNFFRQLIREAKSRLVPKHHNAIKLRVSEKNSSEPAATAEYGAPEGICRKKFLTLQKEIFKGTRNIFFSERKNSFLKEQENFFLLAEKEIFSPR